jgi:hypothetical protein
MTVTSETAAAVPADSRSPAPWWRTAQIWGALAIVSMWVAVLFVGVYGGDMTFASPSDGTTVIPVGVVVAICAAVATGSVSRRVFSR